MHTRDMHRILLGIVCVCVVFGTLLSSQFYTPVSSAHHASPFCQWEFVRYTPSVYELSWTDNIKERQENVCPESNKQLEEVETWMTYANSDRMPESVFSLFVFRNNCTGEKVVDYIEPLAGLTRSPYYCLKGSDFVVQKDYMVVSRNIAKHASAGPASYTPKSLYFDLGASTYSSGGGGPSQSWFVETYESRGIHWDGIYAWEAVPYPPAEIWADIPSRLKPVYHWYNIPVVSDPNHPDNVFRFIEQVARPEDYVLLKIDIDNTPIEEELVRQLLASKTLLELVDEFYFEHHVNTAPMHPYWGKEGITSSLEDTYRIFTTLRRNGVIAHSWV